MIYAYTDGSCKQNIDKNRAIGEGGIGIVIVKDDKIIKKIHGSSKRTTANKMEILAVYHALKWIEEKGFKENVQINTDSRYVKDLFSNWIYKWVKNGWKLKDGFNVKNREYIEKTFNLKIFISTKFEWVKAHNGDKYNEEADRLAKKYMERG